MTQELPITSWEAYHDLREQQKLQNKVKIYKRLKFTLTPRVTGHLHLLAKSSTGSIRVVIFNE